MFDLGRDPLDPQRLPVDHSVHEGTDEAQAATVRRLGAVALAGGCALTALYAIALGTRDGLRLDRAALPHGFYGPEWRRSYQAFAYLTQTIQIATVAFVIVGLAFAGRRRGRRHRAGAGVIVVIGANLTTQILKPVLGHFDPLGGEVHRLISASFPSGHATASMSTALAVLIVATPTRRPALALLGGSYAAGVGVGMLVTRGHFPSDVAAGYLVAATWAAIVTAVFAGMGCNLREGTTGLGPRRLLDRRHVIQLAASLLVASSIVLLAAIIDRTQLLRLGRLHAAFFTSAALSCLLALILVSAAMRYLGVASSTQYD